MCVVDRRGSGETAASRAAHHANSTEEGDQSLERTGVDVVISTPGKAWVVETLLKRIWNV